MAYRFDPDEDVREAIARCAREQLDHAVAELSEGVGHDPVAAVHSARKAVKKERSLLRLARGAMSPEQRRGESHALRQAARGLSGARDADVMLETVAGLSDRFGGQVPHRTFTEIAEQLVRARDARRERSTGSALDSQAVQELGLIDAGLPRARCGSLSSGRRAPAELHVNWDLWGTMGEPLRDPSFFREVRVDPELQTSAFTAKRSSASQTRWRLPRRRSARALGAAGRTNAMVRSIAASALGAPRLYASGGEIEASPESVRRGRTRKIADVAMPQPCGDVVRGAHVDTSSGVGRGCCSKFRISTHCFCSDGRLSSCDDGC